MPTSIQYSSKTSYKINIDRAARILPNAFVHEGYKFEVLDLEGVRVEQLLVTRIP